MTDSEGLRKALESAKAHLQRISEWAKNDRATWGITLDNIEVEAAIQVREIERALDAVSPPAPCEGCGICMKDCPHQPALSPAPVKPFITESDAAGYERDCNNGE